MTDFQDGQTDVLDRLTKVCAEELNRGFFRNKGIESVLEEIIKIGDEVILELARKMRVEK